MPDLGPVKSKISNNFILLEGIMPQRTITPNPSEETIQVGPIGIRFLLTGDDSNGSLSVFEFSVPAGHKLPAPAHKNDAYEEMLYGLEGVLTWTVDGTPIEVGPGQALCIPRGAVHRFDNFGSQDVKQLVVHNPCDNGPRILPRSCGSNRRCGRRPARPREDDRGLPASWHDGGRATDRKVAPTNYAFSNYSEYEV